MSAAAVRAMTITSKEQLKTKFELLQLMRDMLGVTASGSGNPLYKAADESVDEAVLAQYEALECDIDALDDDSDEFYAVLAYLRKHKTTASHKDAFDENN